MKTFSSLAIQDLDLFVFGSAPHPVKTRGGLVVGAGTVFPELNFTLPNMAITDQTMPEVEDQYRQMITDACQRAVQLHATGLVVEFELLPDLTLHPEWGIRITKILREILDETTARHALPCVLRVTPNDIREFSHPPLMRRGEHWDNMLRTFEGCGLAGADFLAVESTGGKEIHDTAILNADLATSAFALGVLGARDMAFLWDHITAISEKTGAIPSGDSACGFANTAMVLAEQSFIPRVWAAVIRVMTVARSLVAFEHGAQGPNKDCAYEGPYIKAITGCPISLEGAEAACAHLSPIGNIAHAVADLWSNESVNNIKLLGGMAPTVSLEQLVYAARLMNTASSQGPEAARQLRDWFTELDSALDPQAFVLRPDIVLQISQDIIQEPTPWLRTRRSAIVCLEVLRKAHANGVLGLSRVELRWLDQLSRQADTLPEQEDAIFSAVADRLDPAKIALIEYDLE